MSFVRKMRKGVAKGEFKMYVAILGDMIGVPYYFEGYTGGVGAL